MSASRSGQPNQPVSHQSELEYDFDLHHVAQHNAQQAEQPGFSEAAAVVTGLPSYQEPEPIGLGMNLSDYAYPGLPQHDQYAQNNDQYLYSDVGLQTPPPAMHTPPTPRSNATNDGRRNTRNSRSGRRTDSPMSSDHRVSKSKSKGKGTKKPPKLLPPEYQLDVPFTLIDHDWGNIPLKQVDKRATWSKEERKKQATKKDGHISRPMNAFLLYRSAWADRCKSYFGLSNHQYVSQILGASWSMESAAVKDRWKALSTLESDNHKVHLPDYRYQPSKPAGKRELDSDHDDYGVDDDPDGEYMPSGRLARQARKQPPSAIQQPPAGQYGQDVYGYPVQMNMAGWGQEHSHRPQPAQYAQTQPYPGQGGQYLQAGAHHQWQVPMEEMRMMNSTPASTYSSGHGLVGLPGGPSHDMLHVSRTQTPMQQYQQPQAGGNFMDQSGSLYPDRGAHQNIDTNFGGLHTGQESHFSEAIADFGEVPVSSDAMLQEDIWLDPSLGIQTEYSFALDDNV